MTVTSEEERKFKEGDVVQTIPMTVTKVQSSGKVYVKANGVIADFEPDTLSILRWLDDNDGGLIVPEKSAKEMAALIRSQSAQIEALKAGLKPFARAVRTIDAYPDGTPYPDELRVSDNYSVEAAIYEVDQPTVGDLRTAAALLTPPTSKTGE